MPVNATLARVRNTCIVAFCLWHMSAIGLWLLPDASPQPIAALKAITKPYVLLLSQWQRWDIFSPEPLRLVTIFSVQLDEPGDQRTLLKLAPQDLPWWRRAKELKILERQGDWNVVAPLYLHSFCAELPEAAGRRIRLATQSMVLPQSLKELRNMASAMPIVIPDVMAVVQCPPLP